MTLSLFTLVALLQTAAAPSTTGTVFDDRNGNGTRDAGEAALPGVSVSNQDDVVVTDAAGNFSLPPGPGGIVFVSVPDGYASVGAFWRPAAGATAPLSFALRATQKQQTFSFAHASDTHIAPPVVERTRRLRTLVDSIHPAFLLVGGDLVRDAMSQTDSVARSYYELYIAETKPFKTPIWQVPGNHENYAVILGRTKVARTDPLWGRGMYRSYLGPDYYSFTYGGVHFMGLNAQSMDDSAYYGNIDSLQLNWMKKDLEHVPASMPIVTFNHIPMLSAIWGGLNGVLEDKYVGSIAHANGKSTFRHEVGNFLDVVHVMKGHRWVLSLGSHGHAGEKLQFITDSLPTRFEMSAAVVGPSPFGDFTFPSGFTLYTVRKGEIDAGTFVPLDPVAKPIP